MAKKALFPFYMITIDDEDEATGFEYNALVDFPAHMRAFDAYGKAKRPSYFVEDKKERIITGVAIAEGTPIYRNDDQFGEHYVVFTAEAIRKIWLRLNRNNYMNRSNRQHNTDDLIALKDMFMIEQWIVRNGVGVPDSLSKQGIRPGSLMFSYKIESDKLWRDIEAGKYNGFSIEGMFIKYGVTVKKSSANETLARHKMMAKILKKIGK